MPHQCPLRLEQELQCTLHAGIVSGILSQLRAREVGCSLFVLEKMAARLTDPFHDPLQLLGDAAHLALDQIELLLLLGHEINLLQEE